MSSSYLTFYFDHSLTTSLQGSKLAWTLLFGAGLYLAYGRLPDDPVILVANELLLNHEKGYSFLFVGETVLSWLRGINFEDRVSDRGQRLHQLYGATHELLHEDKWAPKTFTVLFVGMLVDLFRCACSILHFGINILSVVWTKICPAVTWCMRALLAFLWYCCLHTHDLLLNQGYTWKSPFDWLLKTRPLELWNSLQLLRVFIFLLIWMLVLKIPFKPDLESATWWDQRDAFVRLSRMSLRDIANLILAHDKLKAKFDQIEDQVRQKLTSKLQVDDTMKALAQRAISFRTSLDAMCVDYNCLRNILDNFASTILNALTGVDPLSPRSFRHFRTSRITVANVPFANGLHYTTVTNHCSLKLEVKNRYADDMHRLFNSLRVKIKLKHGYTYIPEMDLLKPDT